MRTSFGILRYHINSEKQGRIIFSQVNALRLDEIWEKQGNVS